MRLPAGLRGTSPGPFFASSSFRGVELSELPRVYVATPREVARRLRESAKGRGDTILYEHHRWGPKARGAGTVEEIPEAWKFSGPRIEELFGAA